ncbi:hypothetical protein AVEN_33535-1, partial [Araneus ventricosus]
YKFINISDIHEESLYHNVSNSPTISCDSWEYDDSIYASTVLGKVGNMPYGVINLWQREIPNASVKTATVQQTARLWFYESKSIVTVQRRFRLEYRNCQSPNKNSIKRWYESFKLTGNVVGGESVSYKPV